jgi:hypothetical protein
MKDRQPWRFLKMKRKEGIISLLGQPKRSRLPNERKIGIDSEIENKDA